MRVLVTGFTSFGRFAVNPSVEIGTHLARAIGAEFEPLEVAYAAVDAFVERLIESPPEVWVMVGVAGEREEVSFEREAWNRVGVTPDVRGVVRGPGVIDAGRSVGEEGTLWRGLRTLPTGARWTYDAGGYLCNYVYWKGLTRLAGRTRCGFVHVVPAERMEIARQAAIVTEVVKLAVALEKWRG